MLHLNMYNKKKKNRIRATLRMAAISTAACLVVAMSGCSSAEMSLSDEWTQWLNRAQDRDAAISAASDGYSYIGAETQTDDEAVLLDGIYIEGQSVGGMTVATAREVLSSKAEEDKARIITIMRNGQYYEASAGELGLSYDIESALKQAQAVGQTGGLIQRYRNRQDVAAATLQLSGMRSIEGTGLEGYVEYIAEENDIPATEATITYDGGFTVTDEADGLETDIEATTDAVSQSILTQDGDITVDAVTYVAKPHYTADSLSQVSDVLGTFSTDSSNTASSRMHNITLAVSRINGTCLMPGDQVSTASLMGERTSENGYQTGTAYVNGVVEDSVGGGVCQVATTIYNALLESEIQVDERHNHSMVVSYVSPGLDATISGDSKDLVFTNNTEAPIYIYAETDGTAITVTIYGKETRASNRTVEYVPTTVYSVPSETIIIEDSSQPEGYESESGGNSPEMEVYVEKVVYIDGQETERTRMHTDYYEPSHLTIIVGTG